MSTRTMRIITSRQGGMQMGPVFEIRYAPAELISMSREDSVMAIRGSRKQAEKTVKVLSKRMDLPVCFFDIHKVGGIR